MADQASEIAELKRLLKIAQYERDFLQTRLDAIRANKEELVALLDTPTIEETVNSAGDIDNFLMDVVGRGRG